MGRFPVNSETRQIRKMMAKITRTIHTNGGGTGIIDRIHHTTAKITRRMRREIRRLSIGGLD
jgi:hypothetical protein